MAAAIGTRCDINVWICAVFLPFVDGSPFSLWAKYRIDTVFAGKKNHRSSSLGF